MPGCSTGDHNEWCADGIDPADAGAPCAWAPDHLKQCMEGRDLLAKRAVKPKHKHWDDHKFYSELIMNASRFESELPHSIEAIFFLWDGLHQRGMDCRDATDGPKCEAYARKAHARILSHFNLAASELPLLTLDLWNWRTPFADTNPHPQPPRFSGGGGGRPGACMHPLCAAFRSWIDAPASATARRFYSMWGRAYERRHEHSHTGCFDWQGVTADAFFQRAFDGATCDRNWLEGAIGGAADRPFKPDSPALLGFDETINEECSRLLGVEPWDNADLNGKIAHRCRDARRNVLRLLTGGWTMCQNLEWQLCALTGRLPGQGARPLLAFATAPRELQLQWWEEPSTHPTFPCVPGRACDPSGFTVGDVFFAEVAVAYTVCANRDALFELNAGELFECELDARAYRELAEQIRTW